MVRMKFPSCFQQFLIVFACLLENLYCYRPLVLIHGINSDYKDLSDIEAWAQADFPGIQTFSLDAFNNDYSIVSMRTQVIEILLQLLFRPLKMGRNFVFAYVLVFFLTKSATTNNHRLG